MNTTFLLGLAFVAVAPAPKDHSKKDPPPLVGEWAAESLVVAGRPRVLGTNPMRFTFTADGKWYSHRGKLDPTTASERAYHFDPKADPPTIDLIYEPAEQESQMGQGIYKVEGDTLTICLRRGRTGRPKAFESTAAAPTTLYTFKRVKP